MAKTEFMVVIDDNRHVFSVHGPMDDDMDLTRRVEACQRNGRRVRCFSVDDFGTKEEVIAAYREEIAYELVDDSLVLEAE